MHEHLLITPFGYYLRVTVPKDLRAQLGKREIKRTLSTRDRCHAIKAAQLLMFEIQQLFSSLRGASMTSWSRKPIVPNFSEMVERKFDAKGRLISELEMTPEEYLKIKPVVYPSNVRPESIQELESAPLSETTAIEESIPLANPSLPYISRMKETLQEKSDQYLDEHENKMSIDGLAILKAYFERLIIYLGNVPLKNVTRLDATNYIKALSIITPYTRNNESIREIAASNKILIDKMEKAKKKGEEYTEIEVLNPATVNKNIAALYNFWVWCQSQDPLLTNPFVKQFLPCPGGKKRTAFSVGHIDTIFRQSLFMLQNSESIKIMHTHYFMVPLIGVYSGMRIEEICQLHLSDLRLDTDIWVFDINDAPGKRLKNESSKRIVPIHSALISFGLLEYADELRNEGETLLFPNLLTPPDEKTGKFSYGNSVTQWFSRYLDQLQIKSDDLVFHSFRHTFASAYKQLLAKTNTPLLFNDMVIKELLGHAHEGVTFNTYGTALWSKTLQDAIESLNFGIDLTTFVIPWSPEHYPLSTAQRRLRREAKNPYLLFKKAELKAAVAHFAKQKARVKPKL